MFDLDSLKNGIKDADLQKIKNALEANGQMISEEIIFLQEQANSLNDIVEECHGRARKAGWFTNLETGEEIKRNIGEMLCLIHSEISEAMEGYRKNLKDTHLTERPMIEVELADAIIRIADLAGYLKLDLGGAYKEKLLYNATRKDHKVENRLKGDGKKF